MFDDEKEPLDNDTTIPVDDAADRSDTASIDTNSTDNASIDASSTDMPSSEILPETPHTESQDLFSESDFEPNTSESLSPAPISDSEIDSLLGFGSSSGDDNARDLNQFEIDNLLGFDSHSSKNKSCTGIDAILNKSTVYFERLPMLEVVFDRLLRLLSTSLRNFTSDNVEVTLESMRATLFGDYLNSIPFPALLGVFKAVEWENQGLLVVDSSLIYSIVDVLLGGRHAVTASRIEGRPYTTIERNLIERLMTVFLDDLGASFEPVSPVKFQFERLEINPHFATIARATNAGILVKLRFEIDDRGGRINLMLPYATIEPVRDLLLQNFMGEKFGRDPIWENHLTREIWETEVTFNIELDQAVARLADVLSWKVGDSIHFKATPTSLVTAISGEHPLFKGIVGQKNGKVAIKIEENLMNTKLHDEQSQGDAR